VCVSGGGDVVCGGFGVADVAGKVRDISDMIVAMRAEISNVAPHLAVSS
jgi:hypothetical protein